MKISVTGLGYIGLANAILLAKSNDVTAVDINEDRLNLISRGLSPISDPEIEAALKSGEVKMKLSSDPESAYRDSELIIVCVPTDSAQNSAGFDTSIVESVIEKAHGANPEAAIAVRSTLPIGFTVGMCKRIPGLRLMFVPEFSREGRSLYDCLHPSRIVVGVDGDDEILNDSAKKVARLFLDAALIPDVPLLFTGASEAEAVKLFANTYLAMRIGFFNELDTFAEMKGLNTRQIIDGMGYDVRIGSHYNNPSFGFGGNCLPKDASQLLKNYTGIPNSLIASVSDSNLRRKAFIANRILTKAHGKTIGIYRLTMKKESDNFRRSSIFYVIDALRAEGEYVMIYEPTLEDDFYNGITVIHDLKEFKDSVDIIIANRWSDELNDVAGKVYTRDLYKRD